MPEPDIVGFISWGAVFAGVISILAFQYVFTMLGLSFGLRQIQPTEKNISVKQLGAGAGIYSLITSLISVYLGAWIAGRLAGDVGTVNAMLHGIVAWGFSILVTGFIIARGTGVMVSGTIGTVMDALKSMSAGLQQAAQAAAPKIKEKIPEPGDIQSQWDKMHKDIENLLRETGKSELQPETLKSKGQYAKEEMKRAGQEAAGRPESSQSHIEETVRKVLAEGKDTLRHVDKQAIVNVLEKETRMNHQQADETADKWINTFQQVQGKMEEVKEEVTEATKESIERSARILSQAALLSFIMLVLTLGAAMLGAARGAVVVA